MFDKEMMKALEADGEKLTQLTGEDHGPAFLFAPDECPHCQYDRQSPGLQQDNNGPIVPCQLCNPDGSHER
jgi:hypothetical protein